MGFSAAAGKEGRKNPRGLSVREGQARILDTGTFRRFDEAVNLISVIVTKGVPNDKN